MNNIGIDLENVDLTKMRMEKRIDNSSIINNGLLDASPGEIINFCEKYINRI